MAFFSEGHLPLRETKMNKTLLILTLILSVVISGCSSKSEIQRLDVSRDETIEMDLLSYDGDAAFEITDAYITDNPGKEKIDPEDIDEHSFVMYESQSGKVEEAYRDEFLNHNGTMKYGAMMYVLHIKVTNVNAEYKNYQEDGFDTPYIFRADNIFMNFIDEKGKAVLSKSADYFSGSRREGRHWSYFELKPGETKEYAIGFIVGNVHRENGVNYCLNQYTPCVSSMQGGLEQPAKQYQIEWEDRRECEAQSGMN